MSIFSELSKLSELSSIFAGAVIEGTVKFGAGTMVPELAGPLGVFASATLTGVIPIGFEIIKDFNQAYHATGVRNAVQNFVSHNYKKKFAERFCGGVVGGSLTYALTSFTY